jgi:hypothetical protein
MNIRLQIVEGNKHFEIKTLSFNGVKLSQLWTGLNGWVDDRWCCPKNFDPLFSLFIIEFWF